MNGAGIRLTLADLEDLIEQGLTAAGDSAEYAEAEPAYSAPAGPASILEFFDVPTGDSFDVAPDDAIARFNAKKLKPTFSYADMIGRAHMQAFTVAKMMDVDMLGQVRASLEGAMANGQSFKEWSDGLIPMLQGSGWWGRKEMVDPLSGQTIVAGLGSPHRLETIFRTNMQAAYAEQQWLTIDSQKDIAPYLMYDAVDDHRTRPSHKARDNTILPVDHAWWNKNTPPLGYNCRCGVIQLSEDELAALGKAPNKKPPDIGSYEWKNPRTGKAHKFPNGVDPGFDHNVGKLGIEQKLKKILAEKVAILPADLQAAVNASLAKKPITAQAIDAAVAAEKAAIDAKLKAVAEAEAAKLAAQAKEAAAAAKLKEIAGYDMKTGAGQWLKKAVTTLSKIPGWENGSASAQLAAVEAKAAKLLESYKLSTVLSAYKKSILAGKVPAPSQKKAFESLSAEDQDAFLAKIDKEKAAIAAAKPAPAPTPDPAPPKVDVGEVEPPAPLPKAKPAPNAPEPIAAGAAPGPNMGDLVQIGPQKGSNPGGLFQDTRTGERWYIKTPASEDIARNEVLAGKLYELAGVEVPDLHLVMLNGKPSIASRIVDGLEKGSAAKLAKAAGTADGFVVDAWLANWDVTGLSLDNLLMRGARAVRVDTGGALRYRAQGGLKGDAFGDKVTELESLRDPGMNAQSASVFGNITKTQMEASARRVIALSDDDIRAVVNQHGPRDPYERAALMDRMIARKADIARRFPDAVEPEAPAPIADAGARVTAAEQKAVIDSRVNGYAFKTDGDQIEDQAVRVHAFKDAAGADMTRGWLKLREGAAGDLLEKIKQSAPSAAADGSGRPSIDLYEAGNSILTAIKGINSRASKGEALLQKDIDRAVEARAQAAKTVKHLRAAMKKAKAADAKILGQYADILETWSAKLADYTPEANAIAGIPAKALSGTFPSGSIPLEVSYDLKAVPKKKEAEPAGLKWMKGGQLRASNASFQNSHARMNGDSSFVPGVGSHYYADLPGGGRITFVPDDSGVSAYAMRGVMMIDAPGASAATTTRIFTALDDLGLNGKRAADIDTDNLYLNRYARMALAQRPSDWAEFIAIDRTLSGADAAQAKLRLLKQKTGVDIAATDGWANRAGIRQAFGHGGVYQNRPDLDTPEFRTFARGHVVYHNPMSLSKTGGSTGVWEKLKVLVNGGGQLASLTDRIRRGVPLDGSSVSSDFQTGGASYVFTRIKNRGGDISAGFYWKADVLKRLDAITYESDMFGRVTPGVESSRLGQSVDDFKRMARMRADETIFKEGLSIFDDLEMVVLHTKAEKQKAIKEMGDLGYTAWPDGRPLADVFKWEGEL